MTRYETEQESFWAGHFSEGYRERNSGESLLAAKITTFASTLRGASSFGYEDRLFKRDFAGDLIDRYGLELIEYDFLYHRDNNAVYSDTTWFLLRKPT